MEWSLKNSAEQEQGRQQGEQMSLTASPPIGLYALAFPAMATVSCATLLPLPQHCTQVEGGKKRRGV